MILYQKTIRRKWKNRNYPFSVWGWPHESHHEPRHHWNKAAPLQPNMHRLVFCAVCEQQRLLPFRPKSCTRARTHAASPYYTPTGCTLTETHSGGGFVQRPGTPTGGDEEAVTFFLFWHRLPNFGRRLAFLTQHGLQTHTSICRSELLIVRPSWSPLRDNLRSVRGANGSAKTVNRAADIK